MLGVLVHALQIVERRGRVRKLTNPLIVFALAAPHAAEVEPQHREAQIVEGVVQVVDNLVVHRSAELRMRMKHDRNWGVTVLLRVITSFKTALGAGKDHFGHFVAFAVLPPMEIAQSGRLN